MAISGLYLTKYNVNLQEAYLKIDSFNGTKDEVRFNFSIFANVQSRINGFDPIEQHNNFSFLYDLNNYNNIISQCYTFLKTLPQFSSFIDLLEPLESLTEPPENSLDLP